MLKKMILITAAALALAPVASAGRNDRYDDDDYRFAPVPRVAALADELEEAARHAHRSAERRIPPHGYFERETLASLHRLEQRARHFHRTVEGRGHDFRHVERDFHKLLGSFDAAAYNVARIRSPHVRQDFRRVERLVNRLVRNLDVAYGHGRGPVYDDQWGGRTTNGSVVFGDYRGRTQYRVRVDW